MLVIWMCDVMAPCMAAVQFNSTSVIICDKWGRLVKNIMGQTKIWEQRVVITDESVGVSQLLGARARAPLKSTSMLLIIFSCCRLICIHTAFCQF